ncbi:MAG: DnaD domain protein [Clostridia bacterium]
MAFCKFSSEAIINNYTQIDNSFFETFLPSAPDSAIKVYLLGLYLCSSNQTENTLERFSKTLKISEQDALQAFLFWEEQGLVSVLSSEPFEVRFLPLKNATIGSKKFSKTKYSQFTLQAQEILCGKMISPNEFSEYYCLMDSLHIEQEALLMIIKYCVKLKSNAVGWQYIVSVAKNWAYQGILSSKDVEQHLFELEQQNGEINKLLSQMGIKRIPTIEEREMFKKWTSDMDFSLSTLLFIVKNQKQTSKILGFDKLNVKIKSYYEAKLFSTTEIQDFENQKQSLFECAKDVCKSIGVFYESLDPVVENYISKWTNMGYDNPTLCKIASYCFKNTIRTLDGADNIINKFFKLGLISSKSIDQHLFSVIEKDQNIKNILNSLNISRNVTNWDRSYYTTWIDEWRITNELMQEAIKQSAGKSQPMQYLNKILSEWHIKGINTLEQATKQFSTAPVQKTQQNFEQRDVSKETLNALFHSLDEVEI